MFDGADLLALIFDNVTINLGVLIPMSILLIGYAELYLT